MAAAAFSVTIFLQNKHHMPIIVCNICTVCTVRTVHTVCNVHTVRTARTVCNVRTVCTAHITLMGLTVQAVYTVNII